MNWPRDGCPTRCDTAFDPGRGALGIGIDGVKHPLALVEGSTENATLVTDLLVEHFPAQPGGSDVNELPDHPVLG